MLKCFAHARRKTIVETSKYIGLDIHAPVSDAACGGDVGTAG